MNKISTKFFLSFVLIFLFIVVQTFITVQNLQFLKGRIQEIVLYSEEIDNVHELQHSVLESVMPANDYLITGNPEEKNQYERLVKKVENNFDKLYEFPLLTKEEKEILDEAKSLFDRINKLSRNILIIENPIGNAEGARMMEEMDALAEQLNGLLDEFHEIDHREIETAIERTNNAYDRMLYLAVAFSLGILVLAILLAIYLSSMVVRPIGLLTKASKSIVEGHYEPIDIGKRRDELGILVNAFNTMSSRIQENIRSISTYAKNATKAKEQAMKRAKSISTIVEAGNAISATIDIHEIIGNLLKFSTQLMKAEKAAVFLYDEKRGILECTGCKEFKQLREKVCGLTIRPFDKTPISEAFTKSTSIYCDDPREIDPKHKLMDVTKTEKLAACLSIPFRAQDKTIGVISVFPEKNTRYTAEEIDYLEILANNVASAIYNALLHTQILQAEKNRQEAELAIAKRIQTSLLPQKAPKVKNTDIGFYIKQAREIGGDFYDFSQMDGSLIITVGDVSGKSIPAALLTSMIKYVLKLAAKKNSTIEPVSILNKVLVEETTPELFTTLIYVLLNEANSNFKLLNAGHTPPLMYRSRTKELMYFSGLPQLPLGIKDTVPYQEYTYSISTGDLIFIYTDGLVEARGQDTHEFYGYERLFNLVSANLDLSSQELCNKVASTVLKYAGNNLRDDLTMVCIKVT